MDWQCQRCANIGSTKFFVEPFARPKLWMALACHMKFCSNHEDEAFFPMTFIEATVRRYGVQGGDVTPIAIMLPSHEEIERERTRRRDIWTTIAAEAQDVHAHAE